MTTDVSAMLHLLKIYCMAEENVRGLSDGYLKGEEVDIFRKGNLDR